MTKEVLKEGLKQYVIRTAFWVLKLPYNWVNKNDAGQLNKADLKAKPGDGYSNKWKIVAEAPDETINPAFPSKIRKLHKEGNELLANIVSSINAVRSGQNQSKSYI